MEKRKRVWILGAGFSRSLGGPLMGDLLSLAARRLILATYSDVIDKADANLVFWLFHFGNGFREGPVDDDINIRGEDRWRDAEHFLEILDNASTEQAKANLVRDAFDSMKKRALLAACDKATNTYPSVFERDSLPPFQQLSAMATRIVAASCCVFLEGIEREGTRNRERWAPYRQWVRWLRANDTVITFNYDQVVEILEFGTRQYSRRVAVEMPGEDNPPHDSARLLKLHGSVGWKLVGDEVVECEPSDRSILGSGAVLAIATPGDNKMRMAKGKFDTLWKQAESALREADDVFVVGFRFPQSDAFPRSRLLAALHDNTSVRLRVHVVLGPEHSSDRQRVLALLQWTVGVKAKVDELYETAEPFYDQRELTAYSLYAEDFLDSWARKESKSMSQSG